MIICRRRWAIFAQLATAATTNALQIISPPQSKTTPNILPPPIIRFPSLLRPSHPVSSSPFSPTPSAPSRVYPTYFPSAPCPAPEGRRVQTRPPFKDESSDLVADRPGLRSFPLPTTNPPCRAMSFEAEAVVLCPVSPGITSASLPQPDGRHLAVWGVLARGGCVDHDTERRDAAHGGMSAVKAQTSSHS
ncbi:hypothetical protein CH35J_009846 [Colletotrichum higginsianum]|uniref:Uncharacterized protein n=1 Tax=Colletotrichum higginsianum TaxID=80884 RepID=A0A4T0VPV8_9PEZI|nr:hypothetical protein CH35J_009846 [Colletotrichum higginsianum]